MPSLPGTHTLAPLFFSASNYSPPLCPTTWGRGTLTPATPLLVRPLNSGLHHSFAPASHTYHSLTHTALCHPALHLTARLTHTLHHTACPLPATSCTAPLTWASAPHLHLPPLPHLTSGAEKAHLTGLSPQVEWAVERQWGPARLHKPPPPLKMAGGRGRVVGGQAGGKEGPTYYLHSHPGRPSR